MTLIQVTIMHRLQHTGYIRFTHRILKYQFIYKQQKNMKFLTIFLFLTCELVSADSRLRYFNNFHQKNTKRQIVNKMERSINKMCSFPTCVKCTQMIGDQSNSMRQYCKLMLNLSTCCKGQIIYTGFF